MFKSSPALPSFTKKARPTGTASAPLILESTPNGFQQAMFSMGTAAPVVAASSAKTTRSGTPTMSKPVKKVKKVRWAPDDVLVAIREIEARTAIDTDVRAESSGRADLAGPA